jgi:hypothetical protein
MLVKTILTTTLKLLETKPFSVTLTVGGIAVVWRVLVWKEKAPPVIEEVLAKTEPDVSVAIALGLASVAAIAAGFAGAIIIFGISADSPIMRAFRAKTSDYLKANWKSVIGSSFLSAIVGLACAFALAAEWFWLAAPLLVFGLLLLIHSIVRMVWLFGVLLTLVSTQDQKDAKKGRRRSTAEVFKTVA